MSDAIPTFGEPEPGVEYVLRPGAYVVLLDDRGHVAVVRDGDAHYLPGGGLHAGESPEEGAARECREECALEVRIGRYLGTADDLVYSAPERTHFRKRCAYFLGELVGPIAGIEPEHELLWLAPAEARRLLTHGSQRWAVAEPLPIACTLTPAELAERRGGLLPGLLARAVRREEIPSGLRWTFGFGTELVRDIASTIEAEHRCCRFLRFALTVEPGDGPVTLEVTGPEGTREFLDGLAGVRRTT